jgi:hypothetical protein
MYTFTKQKKDMVQDVIKWAQPTEQKSQRRSLWIAGFSVCLIYNYFTLTICT